MPKSVRAESALPVSEFDGGIIDRIAHWVDNTPSATAVHEVRGGVHLTYAELWERSGRLAHALRSAGVRIGDTVAVDLPRSADLIVAFLGVVRSGAAYLPFDIHAPIRRLDGILEESGTKLVVGRPGARTWASSGIRTLSVTADLAAQAETRSLADAVVGPEDPVYVTYTSGSTGRPKGVVIPHRAVKRLVTTPNYCVVEPGDRVANTCNPAFDVTASEVWGTLASGAAVVPFPALTEYGMAEWTRLVRSERIATMFLPTSVFHTIAREHPDAFADLRDLVVGGEQLDLDTVRRVLNAGPPRRLVNGYGPTEGTSFATYFECTQEGLAHAERVPIGFPLQGTDLYVLDDELGRVAPGEVGELCLGGPGVANGYLHRPDLTAERFVRDPATGERVYRTGDMVRELPSGALEMLGRRDRQIKLRGFRIELEEVERSTIATGIPEAAFVEKVGEGASAALVGFVLPGKPHLDPDARKQWVSELNATLLERVPDYMVPSRWVVLETVPLGPTGKADRKAMIASLPTREAEGDGHTKSALDSESECKTLPMVRTAISQVIDGVAVPGISFVESGGNSILAVRVVDRLNRIIGTPVSAADLLIAETLEDFSAQVCTESCHRAA
ncbi:non-ribosomal peptide synthetase [Streptomyces sp. NPDC056061]|uniref:non-ribosomal peptide synthetase n=1 Tax=Streptomyces sp. NPDC056061 TaxID=3345700 RepID=UPI0035DBC397